MRSVESIDAEINELKEKLVSVKGTDTEVYTRIVGYYRSVRNWNKGKRDEYNQRKLFTQPDSLSMNRLTDKTAMMKDETVSEKIEDVQPSTDMSEGSAEYLYFYRTSCPNCPPVKDWLKKTALRGTAINVDEKEGFEAAGKYKIYSSPTVVFLDKDGNEMHRASNVAALDELFAVTA